VENELLIDLINQVGVTAVVLLILVLIIKYTIENMFKILTNELHELKQSIDKLNDNIEKLIEKIKGD
jgi:prefoldin subunit 5